MKKRFHSLTEKILKKPLTRELVWYVIFGVATTIVGFGSYALFVHFGLGVALANTLSHVLGILFAFGTNKVWVFRALDFSAKRVAIEFIKFVSSRLAALVFETLLLVLLVDVLGYHPIVCKVFTSILVVVLNYVASKKIVFK